MYYSSPVLQNIPSDLSPEDRQKLKTKLDLPDKVRLYEDMIKRYPAPYFLVQLAEILLMLRSDAIALKHLRKAQSLLAQKGIVDHTFDNDVEKLSRGIDQGASSILAQSQQRVYLQVWRPTKQHKFPTNLPHLPPGHKEVKDLWSALTLKDSTLVQCYLRKLAIETNHIESTFLISEQSTKDIVRHGVAEGYINYLPRSALRDVSHIKNILDDTLAAYDLFNALTADLHSFDKAAVCELHSRLMETFRFAGPSHSYTTPGQTRTATRRTVIVTGPYSIQCCPYPEVDEELEYICKMLKQWSGSWRNPFATASWIHLVLVRCHPFDDGNGPLTRLVASIPLISAGYPPISVGLSQHPDYHNAINTSYDGDHSKMANCILQSMRETIAYVQSL